MTDRTILIRSVTLATVVLGAATSVPAVARASSVPGAQTSLARATFTDQSPGILRLTAPVQMTRDNPAPARGYGAPSSMLADPTNPQVIVAASADLRARVCRLLRSSDAGQTWRIVSSRPAPQAFPYCTTSNAGVAQATIAWGSHGTLYYALAGYRDGEGGAKGHVSILLSRSTDLGDTWTTTVVDNNRQTKDVAATDAGVTGLAVDTSGTRDVVYVGFVQNYPTAPKDSPLKAGAVEVAASTDGGASFGQPVNVNTFSHVTQTIRGHSYPVIMMNFFGGPFMTAHQGIVELVAGAITPPGNSPPDPYTNYSALPQLVARSSDRGRTWSVRALGPPTYTAAGGGTGAQTGIGWTPQGGSQGTFVATYALTPESSPTSGWQALVVQRSSDGGLTWTDPLVIDDSDLSQRFTSFYPELNIAPNGRVDVVWEDNRDQHNDRFQVYYTYSTDGGATWARNVRVSDQPVNFDLGISYNGDVRQTPGVASANQYAFVGWADPRMASDATQTQDAYGDMVQFAALPASGSAVLPLIAAVVDGLATGALLLWIVLLVRRRRQRAGARSSEERKAAGTR